MSTTIDEKVVEMRFDNKQFESNVATSMSTLDKLKKSLKFDGASKGLEDINSAAKRVDMNALGSAVESVKAKFSALDVMAITALSNITNSAVNAGKQLVKSLSVDQLYSGWQKFSDKTTSVATLQAQGYALEEINSQLGLLNWFTDETSYNFTDMVANISKFTATGKGLTESVNAMEGIATWAALSGQNATKASSAMYQLSQALSAGFMRKEDWKSIQNVSMDTDEFRQKTLDAAVALKTLQDNGDGTYTSLINKSKEATDFTKSQFVESLTTGAWFTSDVMMRVFGEYSSAVGSIYKITEEKGMLASEVIDEIHDKADELKTDAMSDSEAIDAAIRKLGYTLDDGTLIFDSFGLKAFEAGQKARTFQDAIDSVKDAVSTKWMSTFELIFGDAEKATELWTDLANTLYDVFAAGGDTRNTILEFALSFAKPWEAIEEKLSGIKKITDKVKTVTDAVGDATDKLEYYQDVVTKVWRGDFNNVGDNPDRFDLLTKAGYDPQVVQDLVNKGYQYKLTIDDVKESYKKFGLTLETTAEETEKTTDAVNEASEAYSKLSDEQLEQAGLTEDEISLYRALEKEADRLKISVNDLTEEMSKNDGRTLLIDSFKNIGNTILEVGDAIKEAWSEIFNVPSIGEIAVKLYGAIKSLNEFSKKLRLVDEDTGEFNKTGQKIVRTFKGIVAIVDVLSTIFGGGLRIALKLASSVLSYFKLDILDITAAIGDALVNFDNWFKSIFDISGVLDAVVPAIDKVVKKVKKWFEAFKKLPWVSKTIEAFKENFGGLGTTIEVVDEKTGKVTKRLKTLADLPGIKKALNWLSEAFSKIGKAITWLSEAFSKIGKVIGSVVAAIKNWFKTFKDTEAVQKLVTVVNDLVSAFSKLFNGSIDINEFARNLGKNLGKLLASLPKIAIQLAKDFVAGFQNGIVDKVSGVIKTVVEFCGNLISSFASALGIHSPSTLTYVLGVFLIAGFVNGIKDSYGEVFGVFQPIVDFISNIFTSLWDYLTDESGKIQWDKIIAGGITISSLMILNKIADAMDKFASAATSFSGVIKGAEGVLKSVKGAIKKLGKAVSMDIKAEAILKIAIAIGILAAAVWILAQIPSDKVLILWNAVLVIAALAGIIFVLSLAMDEFSTASAKIEKSGLSINGLKNGIVQIGVALLLLAIALKLIGSMDIEQAKQGFIGLASLAGGMIVFMALLGGISGYSKDVSGFGEMMIKMAIALALMVIVMKMVARMDPGDIVIGLAVMEAFALLCIEMGIANRFAGEFDNGWSFLKMSITLGIMAGVMKMISKMDPEDIVNGIAVMQGFVILLAEMAIVNRIAGTKESKFGGTIMAMSFSMILLAGVLLILRNMDPDDVNNGIKTMLKFVGLIGVLLLISNLAGKDAPKIASNIIAMAIAIGILAGVAVVLGMLEDVNIAKGLAVVAGLGLIMSAMIWALRGANDVRGSLIVMTTAIGVMAAAVVALSFIDAGKLAGATAAMDSLMLCFSMMIKSLGGIKQRNIKAMMAVIGSFTGVIVVLTGLIWLLSTLDPKRVVPNALAFSTLMLAFALMFKVLDGVKINKSVKNSLLIMTEVVAILAAILVIMGALNAKSSISNAVALGILLNLMATAFRILDDVKINKSVKDSLLTMAGVMAILMVILGVMSLFPNASTMIPNAIALSILINALALAFKILDGIKINNSVKDSLLIMSGVMAILMVILGVMSFFPNASVMIPNAIALSILINALATAMLIASLAGPMATKAAPAMITMSIALAAVGIVLGLMSAFNITPSIETALALSTLMIALSAACLIASLVPAGAGITGAIQLAAFIGIMAAVVAAAGALALIPGAKELVVGGGELLGLIGLAIGKFVGGIIAGIASGVISVIPQLGIALAIFAVSVQPFIALVSGIDASVLAGVGYLTAAILAILAVDFISGIINFMTLGQASLINLGMELCVFGMYANIFFQSIKGVDASAVEAANNVASMILALTASELLSAITEKFGGSVDFSTMGQDLKTFGEAIVGFSQIISGNVDVAAVEAATNAGKLLVELNKSLPRSGGWIQDIIGEQDFGKFATACESFAKCIININDAVSKEGFTIQTEKIQQLVTAGIQFSDLNNALPRSGGIAQDLAGEKDLAAFGVAVEAFANCMIRVNDAMSKEGFTIQSEKLAQLADAGTKFSDLNNALPRSGGIAQDLAGEKDLNKFGTAVEAFAGCIIRVNDTVSQEGFTIDLEAMENLKLAGEKMNKLQNVLPKSGGWWQKIAGEKDIGDFGSKMESFATAMSNFGSKVADISPDAVSFAIATAYRIKYLIESFSDFDTTGLDLFTGIGTGGRGADGAAHEVAEAIVAFSDKVSGINTEAVSVSIWAAQRLKTLINSLSTLDTSGVELFKPQMIGSAMRGYADKVTGIDTNVVASSITSANRLKNFIASLVDLDTSGIGNFKVGSIGSSLQTYSNSISNVDIRAITSSIIAANKLKNLITSLSGLDTSGVDSFKSAINDLSGSNVSAFVKAFSGASSKLASVGVNMVTSLIEGIQSKLFAVKSSISDLLSGVIGVMRKGASKFEDAGGAMIMRMSGGMTSKTSNVTSAIISCLSTATTTIRGKYDSFYSAGSYLADGLADGISADAYKAAAKARAMAEAAVKAAREALKINSPSKVFIEIGSGIPEGFAMGIGMLSSDVKDSVTNMTSTAVKATKSTMSTVLDALSADIDAQPTIRPVIDLTDVQTGANALNGMFNGVQTIGVRSNLNAINSAINAKLQNGSNDDVISAIDKLRNGLETNRGDVYNFGDFTYDDGDNISDAVRTLVRAAKMGRRV